MRDRVERLLQAAQLPLLKDSYTLDDVVAIQACLTQEHPQEWRLAVFDAHLRVVYKGPPGRRLVCVQIANGHARLIRHIDKCFSVSAHFGFPTTRLFQDCELYCVDCEAVILRRRLSSHKADCPAYCSRCRRFGYGRPCGANEPEAVGQVCDECNFTFATADCYESHKQRGRRNGHSRCQDYKKCLRCRRSYFNDTRGRNLHAVCEPAAEPDQPVAGHLRPQRQEGVCATCNQIHPPGQRLHYVGVPNEEDR